MHKVFLSLLFLCLTSNLWSQSSQQEKLEKRKAEIQKEIRDNEKMLKSVRSKEKSAMNVFLIQKNKIRLKENLIRTTDRQAKLLANDIYLNQLKINKLNRELKVLKEDYVDMIVKSYKSKNQQSRIMFLLSSNNSRILSDGKPLGSSARKRNRSICCFLGACLYKPGLVPSHSKPV